jgi:hypothetical protein
MPALRCPYCWLPVHLSDDEARGKTVKCPNPRCRCFFDTDLLLGAPPREPPVSAAAPAPPDSPPRTSATSAKGRSRPRPARPGQRSSAPPAPGRPLSTPCCTSAPPVGRCWSRPLVPPARAGPAPVAARSWPSRGTSSAGRGRGKRMNHGSASPARTARPRWRRSGAWPASGPSAPPASARCGSPATAPHPELTPPPPRPTSGRPFSGRSSPAAVSAACRSPGVPRPALIAGKGAGREESPGA